MSAPYSGPGPHQGPPRPPYPGPPPGPQPGPAAHRDLRPKLLMAAPAAALLAYVLAFFDLGGTALFGGVPGLCLIAAGTLAGLSLLPLPRNPNTVIAAAPLTVYATLAVLHLVLGAGATLVMVLIMVMALVQLGAITGVVLMDAGVLSPDGSRRSTRNGPQGPPRNSGPHGRPAQGPPYPPPPQGRGQWDGPMRQQPPANPNSGGMPSAPPNRDEPRDLRDSGPQGGLGDLGFGREQGQQRSEGGPMIPPAGGAPQNGAQFAGRLDTGEQPPVADPPQQAENPQQRPANGPQGTQKMPHPGGQPPRGY